MKISAFTKRLGVMALVLGVAYGCATAQEQEADVCEGMSPDVQAAINDAQAVVDEARAMGAEWEEAQNLVGEARAAGLECRDEEALRLAREAEMAAQDAIDRYRSAQEEEPMMEEADRSYTVSRGDTLWGISGRSVGYNDPYQWPLIYRANSDVIEDADLIYPGQDLTIEANPSGRAVDAAIEHAKTRGEWSLGVVEDSDRRYLNRWGM